MMKKNEVKKNGFIANKYKKNKLIKNGFFTNRHNKLLKLGVILGFSVSFLLGGCVNQHPDKEQASVKGITITNTSKVEPLVVLKHFGPNCPGVPQEVPEN